MKPVPRISFCLVLLCFFAQAALGAFPFTHPAAKGLVARIQKSFRDQALGAATPEIGIPEIQQAYGALPRTEISPEELYELKFVMQHWRWRTFDFLKRTARSTEVLLSPYRGPRQWVPIPPLSGSAHGLERWARDPSLSLDHYVYRNGFVHLRGLALRPGDLLIVDQNTEDGDGLFAAVTDIKKLASHLGILVFLKRHGLEFPAVLEIHEKGLRAVPLHVFLSPRFVSYAEVYRVKAPPRDWEAGLAREADRFIDEPHAYDLGGREDNSRYLTCTAVGLHLLQRTGACVPKERSSLGAARANLARLGVTVEKVLTPTDFARDSGYFFVGALDYLRLRTNILNELLADEFGNILRYRTIDPGSFPFMFRVNQWGLTQMERRTWVGSIFVRFNGFNEENLPSGPKDLLALYPLLAERLSGAARWLKIRSSCPRLLSEHLHYDEVLSVREVKADPEIRRALARACREVGCFFKP